MVLIKSSRNPRYFDDSLNGKTVVFGGSHTWSNLKDEGHAIPAQDVMTSEHFNNNI